jgi:hypothetical protein
MVASLKDTFISVDLMTSAVQSKLKTGTVFQSDEVACVPVSL